MQNPHISSFECDNCCGSCEEPHGDPDRAQFCCICAYADAPASFKRSYCETCTKRLVEEAKELREDFE